MIFFCLYELRCHRNHLESSIRYVYTSFGPVPCSLIWSDLMGDHLLACFSFSLPVTMSLSKFFPLFLEICRKYKRVFCGMWWRVFQKLPNFWDSNPWNAKHSPLAWRFKSINKFLSIFFLNTVQFDTYFRYTISFLSMSARSLPISSFYCRFLLGIFLFLRSCA